MLFRAADRPRSGAHVLSQAAFDAKDLPGGPPEIGTRDSFGDLGYTIAHLLGVEVEGLDGRSFADRIGLA